MHGPVMALVSGAAAALLGFACARETAGPPVHPPGEPKTGEAKPLQAGATELQSRAPIGQINVYLDGLHVMKDDPQAFLEAHHYCAVKNEDLAQCVIFDGNTSDANLVGVEYIISERLFDGLPDAEKKFWHPHDYEILSGQLVAPGMPEAEEHELMKKKMNSYGKTWHLWDTGHFGRPHGNDLPMGAPELAWSFNADGEAPPQLVAAKDEHTGIDTEERRRERADLVPLAHPQAGVNALAPFFRDRAVPDFVRATGD
jgi:hypothetical protein